LRYCYAGLAWLAPREQQYPSTPRPPDSQAIREKHRGRSAQDDKAMLLSGRARLKPRPFKMQSQAGLGYVPGTSVSWWKGETHLPAFFCHSELAMTLPACFLPEQVASWAAV